MRAASLSCLLLLAACSASQRPTASRTGPPVPAAVQAGWYLEHAGAPRFLPCGASRSLPIVAAADLPARARAFGLEADTPVYVRARVAIEQGAVRVEAVEQFGSPTPVRDCALAGVAIPDAGR